MALGKGIRNARVSKGVMQERLEFIAEINRSYLGRVERGDNNVALLTLLKIAQALDLTIAELLHSAEL